MSALQVDPDETIGPESIAITGPNGSGKTTLLSAYDGALLIVSHDETFLAAVGVTRRLRLEAPGASTPL